MRAPRFAWRGLSKQHRFRGGRVRSSTVMFAGRRLGIAVGVLGFLMMPLPQSNAAAKKTHVVVLGAVKRVPYSKGGDPAGAASGEDSLKIRPLVVDGSIKEW